MLKKKAQALQQLQGLIIPLLVIAIVLVIGILILHGARDQVLEIQSGSWCSSPYGLSSDSSTGSAQCCNNTHCKDDSLEIYNISAGLCCNSTGGYIPYDCGVGNTSTPVTTLNCSTGHTVGAALSYAFNGSNRTIGAISSIPGWLPIIVITIIGAALIGLVAYFRRD